MFDVFVKDYFISNLIIIGNFVINYFDLRNMYYICFSSAIKIEIAIDRPCGKMNRCVD